jgi:hypothetical protein
MNKFSNPEALPASASRFDIGIRECERFCEYAIVIINNGTIEIHNANGVSDHTFSYLDIIICCIGQAEVILKPVTATT